MCHLEPQRLEQLSDWVGSYREYWEDSFERLDDVLEEMQGSVSPPRPTPEKTAKKRGEGTRP